MWWSENKNQKDSHHSLSGFVHTVNKGYTTKQHKQGQWGEKVNNNVSYKKIFYVVYKVDLARGLYDLYPCFSLFESVNVTKLGTLKKFCTKFLNVTSTQENNNTQKPCYNIDISWHNYIILFWPQFLKTILKNNGNNFGFNLSCCCFFVFCLFWEIVARYISQQEFL